MRLNNKFTIEFEPIPPYNFELTLRKPAGWYWSTPEEKCEKETCWSATRFSGKLLGIKLGSTGTIRIPRIECAVYSKTKIDDFSKHAIIGMLKRALKVEEDLTGFYELSQKDPSCRA